MYLIVGLVNFYGHAAFQYYVLLTLMYCAPVWSPYLQADIQLLKRVQRRYTKFISGQYNLDYDSRLRDRILGSMQRWQQFTRACMVWCAAHRHHWVCTSPCPIHGALRKGLSSKDLFHGCKHGALFCCRAPTHWNSLSSSIIDCASLAVFKKKLYAFLLANQSWTLMDFILLTLQSMH